MLGTDESKIELFGHNKGRYALCSFVKEHSIQKKKNRRKKKEKHLLRTVKFGGCTGNLVKADSHMDSTQYQQIFEHNVQE